ncbi:MAG: HAD family phosphatase [Bacteroidota bacterium]
MIQTVIFDLGGVLVDWDPRYVFRNVFDTEAEVEWFLEHICTHDWNAQQDAGRSLKEATELLVSQHPKWESQIRMYYDRWVDMLGGPIQPTVDLLAELLAQKSHRVLALTNWSGETFPIAQRMYEFLGWFEGVLVSGDEHLKKPDRRIYELMLSRYDIDPTTAVFLDDSLANVTGAEAVGITGIHFQSADQLRGEFQRLGIMPG